jgi:hypothetical protein
MKEPKNQAEPYQDEELKSNLDSPDPVKRSCLDCKFHIKKEFPQGSECSVFALKKQLMDKDTAVKFKIRERIEDPRIKFHIYAKFNHLDNWPYEYTWSWVSECQLYENKDDDPDPN